LNGQALARLLLVGLFAAIAVTLASSNNFVNQRNRETTQKRTYAQALFSQAILNAEQHWLEEAELIRVNIELTHALPAPVSVRVGKVDSFLHAQAKFSKFLHALILDDKGRVIYRYDEDGKLSLTPEQYTSNWYGDKQMQTLYRIYNLPLKQNAQLQGSLILFKLVDDDTIKSITVHETELYMYFDNEVFASSNPKNRAHIKQSLQQSDNSESTVLRTDLAWPGTGPQPTLIIQSELHAIFPLLEYIARPILVILMIALFIWMGLGRWLTNTVHRLESLETATNEYARFGRASMSASHLKSARGQPDEISDLAQAMEKLMQDVDSRNVEQKAYLDTLSMLEEAVLELSKDGNIMRASKGWNKLSDSEKFIGRKLEEFILYEDRAVLQVHFKSLISGEKNNVILRLRLSNSSDVNTSWVECRFVGAKNEAGEFVSVRGVLRDITQSYLHEKQITHMALHDALTGLPNRVLLEDRVKNALSLAARSMHKVGVCFIDLDHFKNINDTLGHKSGDKLLLAFAARLNRHLRDGDTLARWGGDEFVLLLPEMENAQSVHEVVQKISAAIQKPLQIEDHELVVTFSMGVAMFPEDSEHSETLFSQADRAMFYAKSQGRNQICLYSDMSSKGIGKKELYIQNRLANAITSKQIKAWYQPVINATTGLCAGVEVLVRWYDEEYGWISPATFIPMAENLGLIHDLGQQIMQESLAEAERWQQAGLKLNLSINVSKRQLFTPYFTERLIKEVALHNIPPESIILEITESVATLDVEHAADRLQEIKKFGFRIALDDFGTGYSSLSQLHEMDVDKLKIDISFVRRLHESNGLSMTQAIINLAKALNMETVAEGVESAETAHKLRQMGVNYLQGFYFAKPMPIDEFNIWMAEHGRKVNIS
jgi:diguanylate cyclase (GGDEF)-like protein